MDRRDFHLFFRIIITTLNIHPFIEADRFDAISGYDANHDDSIPPPKNELVYVFGYNLGGFESRLPADGLLPFLHLGFSLGCQFPARQLDAGSLSATEQGGAGQ